MPTAFKSGTRSATRANSRCCSRPWSLPGPRSRQRPNPFAQLAAALRAMIRFHEAHPDWFPTIKVKQQPLAPEWEAAIRRAYHPTAPEAGHGSPAAKTSSS